MDPAIDDSTSGHRAARQTASLIPESLSAPIVESALHQLILAHSHLRQMITDRLLGLLPPPVSPAAELLSAQDQLALLHRHLEGVQRELTDCRTTESVILACSAALAVADAILFRFILAPFKAPPRSIQDAAIALEASLTQLEALLLALPAPPAAATLTILQGTLK